MTPALFDHACRVYEEMLKRSKKEVVGDADVGDGELSDVYEGHLTRLFAELEIANPYYTKIMEALKGQGCVLQLRRGGGVGLSKWQLVYPPEEETFKAIMERRTAPKGKAAILEQRVNDLMKLTSGLQDQVERLEENYQKLYDDVKRVK